MTSETIKIPKQLMESVRHIIKKTKLYKDETDFISQAIFKQLSKYKDV